MKLLQKVYNNIILSNSEKKYLMDNYSYDNIEDFEKYKNKYFKKCEMCTKIQIEYECLKHYHCNKCNKRVCDFCIKENILCNTCVNLI